MAESPQTIPTVGAIVEAARPLDRNGACLTAEANEALALSSLAHPIPAATQRAPIERLPDATRGAKLVGRQTLERMATLQGNKR
eukprot:scaffold135471_cov31-Tisochrysis_lutea.AAC.2